MTRHHMTIFVHALLTCVASCLLMSAGVVNISVAQQTPPQQQSQARGTAPPPAPSRHALSIYYRPDAAPAFLSAPGTAWYAGFSRIKDFQLPAGALPVRAVDILAQTEGDAMRITVAVFLGGGYAPRSNSTKSYSRVTLEIAL